MSITTYQQIMFYHTKYINVLWIKKYDVNVRNCFMQNTTYRSYVADIDQCGCKFCKMEINDYIFMITYNTRIQLTLYPSSPDDPKFVKKVDVKFN